MRRLFGYRLRRTALRTVLRVAVGTGAHRWWCTTEPVDGLPAGAAYLKVLPDLLERSGPARHVALYWSKRRPDHGMRTYAHFLDDDGVSHAFAKIGTNNQDVISNEASTLARLAGGDRVHFAAPRLLARGGDADTAWILTEPLPVGSRAVHGVTAFPAAAVAAYTTPATFVPWAERSMLSWWPRLVAAPDAVPDSFLSDLEAALHGGLWTASVHGDFGRHNLAEHDGVLWVYDWGEAALDGPAHCDFWAFQFRERGLRRVLQHEIRRPGSTTSVGSMLAAVAYQCSRGMRAPSLGVRAWDRTRIEIGLGASR